MQIDEGYGVAKEALLILDVKTSHKEHLATKGYTLQYLLQGNQRVLLVWSFELKITAIIVYFNR